MWMLSAAHPHTYPAHLLNYIFIGGPLPSCQALLTHLSTTQTFLECYMPHADLEEKPVCPETGARDTPSSPSHQFLLFSISTFATSFILYSNGVFTPEQDNDKTTTRQMLNLCISIMPFTPGLSDLLSLAFLQFMVLH